MVLAKEKKKTLIHTFQVHEGDSGSPEVQVALFTERIRGLVGHLQTHPKDHHSRRGLLKMVSQRKRLLNYLSETANGRFTELTGKLGLK